MYKDKSEMEMFLNKADQ